MKLQSAQYDLNQLSELERSAVRLISDYVRSVRCGMELFLLVFGISPTVARENANAMPRLRSRKPFAYTSRVSSDRIVILSRRQYRVEILFNGADNDGFDFSLLHRHWSHNKFVRRDIESVEDLERSLFYLRVRGWIDAPQREPYVSLLYARSGVIEAVEEWNTSQFK